MLMTLWENDNFHCVIGNYKTRQISPLSQNEGALNATRVTSISQDPQIIYANELKVPVHSFFCLLAQSAGMNVDWCTWCGNNRTKVENCLRMFLISWIESGARNFKNAQQQRLLNVISIIESTDRDFLNCQLEHSQCSSDHKSVRCFFNRSASIDSINADLEFIWLQKLLNAYWMRHVIRYSFLLYCFVLCFVFKCFSFRSPRSAHLIAILI